jgi:hypothetical protein
MSVFLTGFGVALHFGLCGPAVAQNQSSTNASQKPTAAQQLKAAGTGAQPLSHIYDGTKAQPNPVRANSAPKANPVGQPVVSTKSTPGYKPASPSMHSVNTATVPLPASVASKPAPAAQPPVARSTTTVSSPTVITPTKKP